MSTRPYSEDLRKGVISHIESGFSQSKTSQLYKLHINTVNRWWRRYKLEGSPKARARLGKESKLTDAATKSFIQNNPDFQLSDLSKEFKISQAWSSILIRRLGYSYKKNLHLCGS